MQALIKYTDWLLVNRGSISPMIGDKIMYLNDDDEFINEAIYHVDKDNSIYLYSYNTTMIAVRYKYIYVSIDYNQDSKVLLPEYDRIDWCLPETNEPINMEKLSKEELINWLKIYHKALILAELKIN